MYKFLEDGVHGEVLDFAGVITCGKDLDETRSLLASALVDMADMLLNSGEPLPRPNASLTNSEADLEEPIYLILSATNYLKTIPELFAKKRQKFFRHPEKNDCTLVYEGKDHLILENSINKRRVVVPSCRTIVDFTAIKICKQLEMSNLYC